MDDMIDIERRSGGDRWGFALPTAIGALVIIGILVTSGFFMARQELRIGVASKHANMAVNIAQAGANEVMANWNGYNLGNISVWTDTTVTGSAQGGTWSVSIANANDHVYFMTSTGTVTDGGALWAGASRSIGIATKVLFVDIDPPAALMTRGKVTVGGNSTVNGANTTPTSWAPYCSTLPVTDTTGIMVDDDMGGTNPGTIGKSASINGTPPSEEDSTIVDSTFTNFGNLTFEELRDIARDEGKDVSDYATISTIAPSVAGGRCNTADLFNWGDTVPTNTCGSYFPLIYHGGNLSLQSSSFGQGILLVEGNLELRGGFTFMGIIITQGTFTTGTGTNRVFGSIMASNTVDVNESISGTADINYSRCAITRSVLNNSALSRVRPLAMRSWVDLSSTTNE